MATIEGNRIKRESQVDNIVTFEGLSGLDDYLENDPRAFVGQVVRVEETLYDVTGLSAGAYKKVNPSEDGHVLYSEEGKLKEKDDLRFISGKKAFLKGADHSLKDVPVFDTDYSSEVVDTDELSLNYSHSGDESIAVVLSGDWRGEFDVGTDVFTSHYSGSTYDNYVIDKVIFDGVNTIVVYGLDSDGNVTETSIINWNNFFPNSIDIGDNNIVSSNIVAFKSEFNSTKTTILYLDGDYTDTFSTDKYLSLSGNVIKPSEASYNASTGRTKLGVSQAGVLWSSLSSGEKTLEVSTNGIEISGQTLLGEGLRAMSNDEVVIGRFNEVVPRFEANDRLLTLADGTAGSRKDVAYVEKSGHLYAKSAEFDGSVTGKEATFDATTVSTLSIEGLSTSSADKDKVLTVLDDGTVKKKPITEISSLKNTFGAADFSDNQIPYADPESDSFLHKDSFRFEENILIIGDKNRNIYAGASDLAISVGTNEIGGDNSIILGNNNVISEEYGHNNLMGGKSNRVTQIENSIVTGKEIGKEYPSEWKYNFSFNFEQPGENQYVQSSPFNDEYIISGNAVPDGFDNYTSFICQVKQYGSFHEFDDLVQLYIDYQDYNGYTVFTFSPSLGFEKDTSVDIRATDNYNISTGGYDAENVIVGGMRNQFSARNVILSGRDNKVYGKNSIVTGRNNESSMESSFVSGKNNYVKGVGSFVSGKSNSIKSDWNHAEGLKNKTNEIKYRKLSLESIDDYTITTNNRGNLVLSYLKFTSSGVNERDWLDDTSKTDQFIFHYRLNGAVFSGSYDKEKHLTVNNGTVEFDFTADSNNDGFKANGIKDFPSYSSANTSSVFWTAYVPVDSYNINNFSHLEGEDNVSSASHAHVEGRESQAWGDYSHVEGKRCKSVGRFSKSSGKKSRSIAYGSEAKGYQGVTYLPFQTSYGGGQNGQGSYWSINEYSSLSANAWTTIIRGAYQESPSDPDDTLLSVPNNTLVLYRLGIVGSMGEASGSSVNRRQFVKSGAWTGHIVVSKGDEYSELNIHNQSFSTKFANSSETQNLDFRLKHGEDTQVYRPYFQVYSNVGGDLEITVNFHATELSYSKYLTDRAIDDFIPFAK